ncbi:MAG: hypothetical protein R3324_02155 [Halobacteriales archaeon]|nr:hypothetical protein [Halobacteriales archaeon]
MRPSSTVQDVVSKLGDPLWWKWRIMDHVNRPVMRRTSPQGLDIMSEDWDNLVILDACRADTFEAVVQTDRFDAYRRVISRGSATEEWIRRNFVNREFGDTVYVTGNPTVSDLASESFYALIEVWRTEFDEKTGTVLPGPIIESALGARQDYVDKRLIVHFMQPHIPFLEQDDLDYNFPAMGGADRRSRRDVANPWQALERGLLDVRRVRRAYEANLESVIDEVLEFASDLSGRTVITSDHGNAFGERAYPVPIKVYGHPPEVPIRPLLVVPWAVIEGRRISIREGRRRSTSEAPSTEVEERLQQLGYVG